MRYIFLQSKVYPKMSACMKKIGSPDLLILLPERFHTK